MRPVLACSVLLAAMLLASACEEETAQTSDIVTTIPWDAPERAEYVLLDRRGETELAQGSLAIEALDGRIELLLSFEDDESTDRTRVIVDAATLKPSFIRREFQAGADLTIVEGEYDAEAGILQITEISEENERLVPLRLEDHYYENESSLFLWRTIPFEEGYQASYHTVLASQNTQHLVRVHVVRKEEITVPAGTFDTWRVEIRAPRVNQVAWFADTPQRQLVQYDNTRQLFQLTSYEP